MQENGLNTKRVRFFSCLALAAMCAGGLAACGEIAFKRGSGADAFAADRRRCRSEAADPASVNSCLTQAGWRVTELRTDAVSVPEPATPLPVTVPRPAPAASPAGAEPAIAAPDKAATAVPPPVPPKTLIVGNWWRIGTGAADLHAAGDACVAKLGPSDAPDAGYHTVTPALYACLRSAGWHGQVRAAD